jgi:hypothetical protein
MIYIRRPLQSVERVGTKAILPCILRQPTLLEDTSWSFPEHLPGFLPGHLLEPPMTPQGREDLPRQNLTHSANVKFGFLVVAGEK